MYKIIILVTFLLFPLKSLAISAESYIVMDADSARILEEKNSQKEKLIASTTKIMTCIITLENADINKVIKVQNEVLKAYGSAIYLNLNEEITIKDLLYGLMLRSGNDAAIEIAYNTFDNMENFVKKMNEKAYEIGMSNTKFLNNHGLEENDGNGNTSTAYDMALLMRYAIKNETFRDIIQTKNYTAKSSEKTYTWKNKNKLLFTYDKLIGGKTGFTKKAKRTLVTAATSDNKTTIVVTLNDGNDFLDHQSLHEKYLNNYERYLVVGPNTVIDPDNPEKYYFKNNFYMLIKPTEKDDIKIDYQINDSNNSDEVGASNIYLKDKLIGSEKIYLKKELKETTKDSFFKKFLRWLFKW